MRYRLVLAPIMVSVVVTAGCGSRPKNDGARIAPVTASASPKTTTATTEPLPHLPTSPACNLLTAKQVQAALGTTNYQPSGSKSHYYGFAGFLLDIDLCTWQVTTDGQPADSVQVEMDTTTTVAQAMTEYQAFLKDVQQHVAPGGTPTPVPDIGDAAALLPGWIAARYNKQVIEITGLKSKDAATLRRLANDVATALHWRTG